MPFILEDYYSNCATEPFNLAVKEAIKLTGITKEMIIDRDEKHYGIGFAATYIRDHKFSFLKTMSHNEVLSNVKKYIPERQISGSVIGKELTSERLAGDDWLNKMFIIFSKKDGKYLAIAKHDDTFNLFVEG